LEIVRILVRDRIRHHRPELQAECWTTDLRAFLMTPADIVVEAIGGLDPAGTIADHVLDRGGKLVTANKALVAMRGAALSRRAAASGGWLGFEAAVGGGVPIVRTLRDALGGQQVRSFRGILNGTTNYILTRLEAGDALADAISSAQGRGLAEADPSRDLDGRDVADKLTILAWLAWGIDPQSIAVRRAGLPPDIAARVHTAAASGNRLRLIGSCRMASGVVVARVQPEQVPADSALGQTRDEQNRLEIDLGWGSPIALSGPGAGGPPTASALWSDLLDAAVAA
jgi:homoserine dehydrogenase